MLFCSKAGAEIFAAREQNELGISSRDLAEQIPGAEFCPGVEQVAERLAQLAQPGDLILTVGREISSEPENCCWPDKRRARPETEKSLQGRTMCAPAAVCPAESRPHIRRGMRRITFPGEGFWERSLLEEAEDRMIPTGAAGPLWGSLSISNCAVQGVSSCIGVGMEAGQRPFRTIWTV